MRSLLRGFLAGLRWRHPAVPLAALGLALGLAAAGELALRRKAFSLLPMGRFLVWTHDLWSFIPHRLGRMASGPPRERIFLVGSSALHHSYHGPKALADSLAALGVAHPGEIHQLHTPVQSLAETLKIVENLPPGGGILVLNTSPNRFVKKPKGLAAESERSHLMLHSPALLRVLADEGLARWEHRFVLPAFLNYLRLYVSMNRKRLVEGTWPRWRIFLHREFPRGRQLARGAGPVTPPPFPRGDAVETPPLRDGALHHHLVEHRPRLMLQLRLLREILRRARELGYRPVLFETPLNPDYRRRVPERTQVHRRLVAGVAAQEGVTYWDFMWALDLPPEDFMDDVHLKLTSPSRLLFHQNLAAALAAELRRTPWEVAKN